MSVDEEARSLVDDMPVTANSFFRDPELFASLAARFIPKLFEQRNDHEEIRLWNIGCATGEEAYSLTILLLEEAASRQAPARIQLFASDLHEPSLERARQGLYPASIIADVSPERIARYFRQESGGYRVCREVRERVVFAPHNVLTDPPFSRIDLISCRSQGIPLSGDHKAGLTALLHYALRPQGWLIVDESEAIDAPELFRTENQGLGLFRKLTKLPTRAGSPALPVRRPLAGVQSIARGAIHHHLLERYPDSGEDKARASHEKLVSVDEKLISTLEELATSQEELQSANEELTSVNEENRLKVQELAELSSDLQNFLAATSIATLFLDRELRILRFTPQIVSLFNVRETDRGRRLSDLTHRLAYDRLQHDARAVLERLTPVEREIRDELGNWYLTRLLPYRSADDRIGGVVITFVDVTLQKQSENALRQARDYAEQIIEMLPDPLVVLNSSFEILTANVSFYEYFDLAPEMALQRRIYELSDGQWDIPELRMLLEQVLPERESLRDYLLEHDFDNLGRRVMRINASKLPPSQLILLSISDVTELHDSRRELEQAAERKDEFLAMLAHELRNPLAPISMGLEFLKSEPADAAARARVHETMARQFKQLVSLVDDLLDTARISRGRLTLRKRPVVLQDIIVSAVEEVTPKANSNGLELTADVPAEPLCLDGDPHRLAQVIVNLLHNAVKFTPPDGRVRLSARREDNECVVRVTDNGAGFAPAARPSVSAPISRGNHRSTGLGIGLPLVKSLVELHGGRVDSHSGGEGTGASFTIYLPMPERAPPWIDENYEVVPESPPVSTLVVDDSVEAAQMLALLLRKLGHEVHVAYNGRAAVQAVAEFAPEVVIMDIGMPEMDGVEAARLIRAGAGGADVMLIALTGLGQHRDKRRTADAGFDYHLVKPADPNELRRLLAKARQDRD